MEEIRKISTNENGDQLVTGRDLHKSLGVETPYTQWFARMTDYGFSENVDFVGLSQKSEKPTGGRPTIDHALTIGMPNYHLAFKRATCKKDSIAKVKQKECKQTTSIIKSARKEATA